jgi:predicted transcriptional regulator
MPSIIVTYGTTDRRRQIISVWMEPNTIDRLEQLAREADRSRSAELRVAVREHLARAAQPAAVHREEATP